MKKGKLVIRQRKQTKFGSEAFKGIGVVHLELHKLAMNPNPQILTFPLEKCTVSDAFVDVVIKSKFLGDVRMIHHHYKHKLFPSS